MFDLKSSPLALASILFVVTIVATPAKSQNIEPPPTKDGYKYSDSYCINRGHRVKMGGLSCLRVDGRVFLARCDMSLNSPVWRMVQDSCPSGFDTLVHKNAAKSASSKPGTN
jgi:hypothetical protein